MYKYRKLTPEEQKEILNERIASGVPSHQPPHPFKDATYYLLTASCYEHKHIISSPERRDLLQSVIFKRAELQSFLILAWVFLSSHYHILVKIDDFNTVPSFFRNIHGRTSYHWNKEDGKQGRKVWFRYTDRYIRNENHLYTSLNYIHYNPVKHGYVDSPYDWVWSSVHWYQQDKGVEWLRDLWSSFPLHDYGKGWDDL